jgi:hypothetical protein
MMPVQACGGGETLSRVWEGGRCSTEHISCRVTTLLHVYDELMSDEVSGDDPCDRDGGSSFVPRPSCVVAVRSMCSSVRRCVLLIVRIDAIFLLEFSLSRCPDMIKRIGPEIPLQPQEAALDCIPVCSQKKQTFGRRFP